MGAKPPPKKRGLGGEAPQFKYNAGGDEGKGKEDGHTRN